MNGGLLPGCIYFAEYSNYNYCKYSFETGEGYKCLYYLKNYEMPITIILN